MRDDLKFQLVEHLAAPLLLAVAGGGRGDPRDIAALMNRTVQFSIALGGVLSGGPQDETLLEARRVALAALSGRLMAGLYARDGRIPEEGEQARLLPSLETILAFADQFTPAHEDEAREMAARLRALPAGAPLWDDDQAILQYMGAMTQAVQEISGFSFGWPDHKLAQDMAARVTQKAAQLQQEIFGAADNVAAYRQKMALIAILAGLYAHCHRVARDDLARIAESQDMPPDQAAEQALSRLWATWERQAAMFVILARSFEGGQVRGGQKTPQIQPVAQPAAPPVTQAPVEQAKEVTSPPANPMSFFKTGAVKKTEQESSQEGDFAE